MCVREEREGGKREQKEMIKKCVILTLCILVCINLHCNSTMPYSSLKLRLLA